MNEIDIRPIAYDICCGLGGWTIPLLEEGFRVIGFDIERHDYGTGGYPGELRLRDITTIHGSELKDAALIVCSPPCQDYSYMAMPWSRAKVKAAMIEADTTGEELRKLNLLFDTCFRLQREASEAAGHHIPMIVENIRGAQKWVGRAAYHYGSFYLWGDVPALMPIVQSRKMKTTGPVDAEQAALYNCHINEMRDSLKVPGFRFDGSGKSFQTASVEATGVKAPGMNWSDRTLRGQDFTMITGKHADGVKADGSGWTEKGSLASHNRLISNQGVKNGNDWFGSGDNCSLQRKASSQSNSRKAASAMIAKIPYPLASHIARVFKPKT